MRTFELKTMLDETPGQVPVMFDYQVILLQVMTSGGARGLTIEEMRRRMRVADRLEAADSMVELEDADFEVMFQTVRAYNWPRAFVSAIQLEDDLKEVARGER